MMHRRTIGVLSVPSGLAVAALLAAATSVLRAQAPPHPAPPWAGAVDAVFAEFDRPDAPGCALGVYQAGRISYARGYGMADLEHDAPVTPDSVFYAGSVSKQFTAMAVALAIRQGKLAPDDDVRKYVPELPDYGRPITIRHLVHHTSGLRDVNTLLALAGRRDEDAFDNDAVLRIVARQKALNAPPGDRYSYTNSGYALLAIALERATRSSFPGFADANIFKPLGMTVSHFHTDLSRIVKQRAYAYDRADDGSFVLDSPQNERAGAGGLFTTVRELARWDENFYDGRVGGLDTIRMLESPDRLNDGTVLPYGWGLMLGTYRGMPLVEHSGSLGGFRAHIIRFRSEHSSVAVLCNVSSADTGSLVRRVADLVIGGRFREPAPPRAAPRPRNAAWGPPRTSVAGEPSAFAGDYYSDELESSYRVSIVDGRLTVRRGIEREALAMEPGAADEFRVRAAVLRFRRDARGAIAGFTLDADGARGVAFQKR